MLPALFLKVPMLDNLASALQVRCITIILFFLLMVLLHIIMIIIIVTIIIVVMIVDRCSSIGPKTSRKSPVWRLFNCSRSTCAQGSPWASAASPPACPAPGRPRPSARAVAVDRRRSRESHGRCDLSRALRGGAASRAPGGRLENEHRDDGLLNVEFGGAFRAGCYVCFT